MLLETHSCATTTQPRTCTLLRVQACTQTRATCARKTVCTGERRVLLMPRLSTQLDTKILKHTWAGRAGARWGAKIDPGMPHSSNEARARMRRTAPDHSYSSQQTQCDSCSTSDSATSENKDMCLLGSRRLWQKGARLMDATNVRRTSADWSRRVAGRLEPLRQIC